MSQELLNIIETCVVAPLCIAVSAFVIAFINKATAKIKANTKTEQANDLIDKVNKITNSAVITVTQTYVDGLKKDGVFDKEAQEQAFEKAKESVMSMITSEMVDVIKNTYTDFDEYIKTQIESCIANNK